MTYTISGLPRAVQDLFALDDAQLAERGAMRVVATSKPGFPCRISLDDAEIGETVILLHHTSHDVGTPYRSSYAIYVRDANEAPAYTDNLPPVMVARPLALRGFDAPGMLRDARLTLPGDADAGIRQLLANPHIAYIHAHNAAHGCFAARIDRA